MAHGLPIVASPVAAEGLELRPDENALIPDTAEAFASACTALLDDPALADRLGRAARESWYREHRPEIVKASIGSLLESVCPR